ncbi:MAG: hypothetical protein H7232_02125 [Aeromicrobium sp.]|nr:hypothetical protein [Burkholderiales bacterium]
MKSTSTSTYYHIVMAFAIAACAVSTLAFARTHDASEPYAQVMAQSGVDSYAAEAATGFMITTTGFTKFASK